MRAARSARRVRLGVLVLLLGLTTVATVAQDDLEVQTYSYTAGPYDLPALRTS